MSSSRHAEADPEVPETGAVFTFGRAKYAAENAPNKFWIRKDEVSHMIVYDATFFSLLLYVLYQVLS